MRRRESGGVSYVIIVAYFCVRIQEIENRKFLATQGLFVSFKYIISPMSAVRFLFQQSYLAHTVWETNFRIIR